MSLKPLVYSNHSLIPSTWPLNNPTILWTHVTFGSNTDKKVCPYLSPKRKRQEGSMKCVGVMRRKAQNSPQWFDLNIIQRPMSRYEGLGGHLSVGMSWQWEQSTHCPTPPCILFTLRLLILHFVPDPLQRLT